MEQSQGGGGGGDVGLPLRPPACLRLLDSAKDGVEREAVLESLRVEAREVQCRSKEQLVQFRTEVDIFLRLMYKNKSQHRHGLYYRRLSQVRRDLRFLDYPALDKAVDGFTRWTFPSKQSRVIVDQSNQDSDQVSSTLCILLSATRILNQIDKPILAAGTQILGLLSQSFFMSFGLTAFSTLGRLRVLSQQLLFEFAAIYNLLYVFSKQTSEIPNTRVHIVLVESSRPRLPLRLECHWDRGKLCVTETEPPPEVAETVPLTTPLSNGLWFVDDRKSSGVSKKIISRVPISGGRDLWFADDGTRVKYDVSVSGVTAREESPEVPEKTENPTSSLLNLSPGVASINQSVKDELALKVSVAGELSEDKGHTGFRTEDEDRESERASFAANMSESNPDIQFCGARATATSSEEASFGEKILSSGPALGSSLKFMEKKDSRNQCSNSGKVTKSDVAYISVFSPSKTQTKKREDEILTAQATGPKVLAVERMGEVPAMMVENGAWESTTSACREGSSEETSRHASKETSEHTTVQPGASSEMGQCLSARASMSGSASPSREHNRSMHPESFSGTKRPMDCVNVLPESSAQKRMKGDSTPVIIPLSGSAVGELSVTPFSAAIEKDENDIVPFVSVEATSKNLRSLEVIEELKGKPLEGTSTNEALRKPTSEFDLDTTPSVKREARKVVPGLVPGTMIHAAEISGTESLNLRMENSGKEVSVPHIKPGDSKERVGKTRKKKRPKGNESITRLVDLKRESPKRKHEVSQKMTEKKQVADLFSMLLGGL